MASIWKHPKSRYWTACFYDASGRPRRRTTKTSNRRLALRMANEFEKASRNKRTLAQLEKVLRTYHEELGGEGFEKRSLRACCAEWLDERKPSVSDATRKFYSKTVEKLLEYFGERADQPITEVTPSDLVRFRNTLAERTSAVTVNHDLICVKMIFKAARELGRIGENPAEFLKPIREFDDPSETKRRPFTIAELQRLLAVADDEWKSMTKIGLFTGARLSDVALLRWSNVDLERGELRFIARKTGKPLLLPIFRQLQAHIESLPSSDDSNDFLHPRAAATFNRRNESAVLSRQFTDLLELAGLRSVKTPGSPTRRRPNALSFHSLRHMAISMLKDAGVPQAVVQELVGHNSVQVNQQYTHVGLPALERAAEAAFPQL